MVDERFGHGDDLDRLISGYRFTQALRVAVEYDIPERISAGPITIAALGEACGAHEPSLRRLLRALATVGVVTVDGDERVGPTTMSEMLRAGVPGSRRDWLVLNAVDLYPTWAQLGHSVRTGETATSLVYGMDSWSWRASHPEAGARFDAAMSGISRRRLAAFVERCGLGRFATVVDVGGGRGALLAGVVASNPGQRGVLLDQPHVVAGAPEVLTAAGVVDRVEIVAGDFFVSVPAGGDAYVASMVLHDWDDERALAILHVCRRAMSDDATLVLHERVLPRPAPTEDAWDPYFSDLNMLQGPGGRERTEREWRALLAAGGFSLVCVTPTGAGGGISALEAQPAPRGESR
jgi:hypothetical protein